MIYGHGGGGGGIRGGNDGDDDLFKLEHFNPHASY